MKLKKIFCLSLLLVIIISLFYNSFAMTDLGSVKIYSIKEIEVLLKYKDVNKYVHYAVYQKDNKTYPAYCLNPEYYGVVTSGHDSYNVNANKKLTDEKIWRVIINGYPYKSLAELGCQTADEAYTATQTAIYVILHNRNLADYTSIDSQSGKRTLNALIKIINNAKASTEQLPESSLEINEQEKEWTVDEEKNEFVSKTFSIKNKATSGTYIVSAEQLPEGSLITDEENNVKSSFSLNEKFKILIPITSLKESGSINLNVKANIESKPVMYGITTIANTQNYALTGFMTEDLAQTKSINYEKNLTKMSIIKKEYGTEKRLGGVKFSLLNSKKEVAYDNLITNENGEIFIENLLPGKYFIKELETLDGYNKYDDLIEVNIEFNQEVEITVNNTLKNIQEINSNKDIIEVTQNVNEVHMNNLQNNNIINKNIEKKLPVTGF